MRTQFGPFGHQEHRRRRGPFGPGFGPPDFEGGPPFPPGPPGPWGGPGFPFGPGRGGPWGGRGRGRGHGHGRRGRRGDVRAAILALLAERPMHGYEMIQEIGERSGGFWRPSPGSVYPTLQLLADEGLITSSEGGGSKRLFELTDEGRAAVEKQGDTPPWEQIAQDVDPDDVNLRGAIGQLMGATFQVAQAATSAQKARAVEVLNQARRELYAILGEADEPSSDGDE